jgi:hypothetical protein
MVIPGGQQLSGGILPPIGTKKKESPTLLRRTLEEGGDLLSHLVAVPSALTGLTSLFGMVRGGPRRHGHLSFESAGGSYTRQYLGVVHPADFPEVRLGRLQGNILTYGIRRLPSNEFQH